MVNDKRWWIGGVIAVVLAAGGYYYLWLGEVDRLRARIPLGKGEREVYGCRLTYRKSINGPQGSVKDCWMFPGDTGYMIVKRRGTAKLRMLAWQDDRLLDVTEPRMVKPLGVGDRFFNAVVTQLWTGQNCTITGDCINDVDVVRVTCDKPDNNPWSKWEFVFDDETLAPLTIDMFNRGQLVEHLTVEKLPASAYSAAEIAKLLTQQASGGMDDGTVRFRHGRARQGSDSARRTGEE